MSTAPQAADPTIVDLLARQITRSPSSAADTSSEALWSRRHDDVIAERVRAHERFARKVANAQRELERDIAFVNKKEDGLTRLRGETVVLVRRPAGSSPTVYHRAARPCGRVGDPSNFTEQFEPEAIERRKSIGRCGVCWPG